MSYKAELEARYRAARARMGMGVRAPVVPRQLISAPGGVAGSTGVAPPAVNMVDPAVIVAAEAVHEKRKIKTHPDDLPKLVTIENTTDHGALDWRLVAKAVADRHGIPVKDVIGKSRSRPVISARFELMYRLRVDHGLSFPAIARRLNRDHTSVLHAVRTMHKRVLDELSSLGHDDSRASPASMPLVVEAHSLPTSAVA